jgi:hypothetical protein
MIGNSPTAAAVVAVLTACSLWCQPQELAGQGLLDAAAGGHASTVQSLLEKGLSPAAKDQHGRTPLHLAAAGGHQTTAEVLLRHGADINALDHTGNTPLDAAEARGHAALAKFLLSKGGARHPRLDSPDLRLRRRLKPSLKFKTVREFERESREPAVLLDSANVCFFAPKRLEKEAAIILGYLVKAYDDLYQTVGVHTIYKLAVYAFPKGNSHGWGGTSECSIEYDDSNLDLARQLEWTRHKVPHVSGYIEEMAHNFVWATKAQFGWEMIGWSLGAEVSQRIAGSAILSDQIRHTRELQQVTYSRYLRNGCVLPPDVPPNQCDRIHAWILWQCAADYGPDFWKDFFREVRKERQALEAAAGLGDSDRVRNTRYQITIECFERLHGLNFKEKLRNSGISLRTDVRSLKPEAPGWNRRLSE